MGININKATENLAVGVNASDRTRAKLRLLLQKYMTNKGFTTVNKVNIGTLTRLGNKAKKKFG